MALYGGLLASPGTHPGVGGWGPFVRGYPTLAKTRSPVLRDNEEPRRFFLIFSCTCLSKKKISSEQNQSNGVETTLFDLINTFDQPKFVREFSRQAVCWLGRAECTRGQSRLFIIYKILIL